MASFDIRGPGVLRAALLRGAALLLLWLILTLGNRADLPAGLVAAAAATWVSLKLAPPAQARVSLLALTVFVARFLKQSIVAGFDVAMRALDPRLPLRTGFVTYRSELPKGPAESAFCTVASLLPGTLPVGAAPSGELLIHCLDVGQPVVFELSMDEDLFQRVIGME
jgi:multicomponent Na+:H+ antiporter subunit E